MVTGPVNLVSAQHLVFSRRQFENKPGTCSGSEYWRHAIYKWFDYEQKAGFKSLVLYVFWTVTIPQN